MAENLNDVTRAAYNRWLALRLAGDAGAKAAFDAYMVARTAEAETFAAWTSHREEVK